MLQQYLGPTLRPAQLIILLFGTAAIYWAGLAGGFLFDDEQNILQNPKVLIGSYAPQQLAQAALAGHAGPLRRPIAMLSIGLDHAASGLDPFHFKLGNLLIHLLAGISVYYLAATLLYACGRHRKSTENASAHGGALAITAIWLLHPLNLIPVLYVVQRMTSLAALFMIWGLIFYARGRLRQLEGVSGTLHLLVGLLLFGSLAVLSKENGLLLPILMFVLECCVFRFQAASPRDRRIVQGFALITAALPTLGAILFLLADPGWLLDGYANRDFTLVQRLLTEARVMWLYVSLFFAPISMRMGLFHDDFALSTGLLEPWTTLPAVIGLALLAGFAIATLKRWPLVAFGILFFLAGHLMESTVLALELVHEHRNYLPDMGISIALVAGFAEAVRNPRLRLGLAMGTVAVFALVTLNRAQTWGDELQLALSNVRHHPKSARSNMHAGRIFFQLAEDRIGGDPGEYFARARTYFENARQLDDYNLAGYFALLILDDRQGYPVNEELVKSLTSILRNQPISAATANALVHLHQCEMTGPCRFPKETMNRLFSAILHNNHLRGPEALLVLTEVSQRVLSQGDPRMAAYFLFKAIEISPDNAQLRLNYANVLIALGEFVEAEHQIRYAEAVDYGGYQTRHIAEQLELLSEARKRRMGQHLE